MSLLAFQKVDGSIGHGVVQSVDKNNPVILSSTISRFSVIDVTTYQSMVDLHANIQRTYCEDLHPDDQLPVFYDAVKEYMVAVLNVLGSTKSVYSN